MESNHKHLLDPQAANFNDTVVPKTPVFSGNDITCEVYYFKPNQDLAMHRHPNGEQIFFFLKGSGVMTVEEKVHNVHTGCTVFVKANEWHGIKNSDKEDMIAVQVTKVNAGAEYKDK